MAILARSQRDYSSPALFFGSIANAAAVEPSKVSREADPASPRLTILFLVRSLKSLRYFQSALELMIARGHTVRLLQEKADHDEIEQAWLEEMLKHPNFDSESVPPLERGRWERRAFALQAGMAYLHFQRPEYADLKRYAIKAENRAPREVVRRAAGLPLLRTPRGLRLLYGLLAALERAVPTPRLPDEYFDRVGPDVLVVGDVGIRRSLSPAFVRAARRKGIPAATWVASWDNLTTRPQMSVVASKVFVWNEFQVEEAVELHGVSRDRLVVTGAPNFDHWFAWRPRPAAEFLDRVGLDPGKPMVLWVGSAINQWEPPEPPLIERWLLALRASSNDVLREANVLLRPHPLRARQWLKSGFDDFERVVVWPRGSMSMPVDSEQKADYYDSIHHSRAVVGINTSAMIEAAIIGRQVMSFIDPDYHDSQLGALHFSRLLELSRGALRVAQSLDEHIADLGALLDAEDPDGSEAARRFVVSFIRPHGLEREVTPILVDTVEELAATPTEPLSDPRWIVPVRAAIVAAVAIRAFPRRVGSLGLRARAAGARLKG